MSKETLYPVFNEVLPEKKSVRNKRIRWKIIEDKSKKSSKEFVVSQTSNELYELITSNNGKYLGSHYGKDGGSRFMSFDYKDKVVEMSIKTYDYKEVV